MHAGDDTQRAAVRSDEPRDVIPAGIRSVYSAFQEAVDRNRNVVHKGSFELAGRPVQTQIVGHGLAFRTCRAMEHLRVSTTKSEALLEILLWDETETGVSGPPREVFDGLGRQWIACGGTLAASPDGRFVGFRYQESVVILDRIEQHIIGYRRNGAHLSGGEYSKPLLLILNVWYHGIGVQPLHTALVAHDGAGVMVPGVSGAGKSTTALACTMQGLDFLGDDYIGLERLRDGGFVGHSFFSSTCVVKENLLRFPGLQPHVVEDALHIEEKPILFLAELFAERILKSTAIAAIALPKIGEVQTRVVPARPGETLRYLAASTLHTVVPRPGRDALRMLGELAETVPSYWLLLGPDLATVGPSVGQIASLATARACSKKDAGGLVRRDAGYSARPRVLVLAESLPWPSLKGGDLRTWQNVSVLTGMARVGVFGLCSNDSRSKDRPELPLELWRTSTDPALSYPPPAGVNLAARAWLLDPQGHPSDLFYTEAAASEIAQLLDTLRPEVALVEGLWMHRYIQILRDAGCRVILDCHNVEAALFEQLAESEDASDLASRVKREVIPARTEAIERAAVLAVDEIWVCSAQDERNLRDRYAPDAPVRVVPNTIRLADYDATLSLRRERRNGDTLALVFPGIFSYLPNAHAARYLTHEIAPRLASLDDVPFSVVLVGAMPTDEMLESAKKDSRIVVTGAVRDVRPYLAAATVMAVPLFHGSGTRYKVLEAFAAGLPVVTTAKGVEGLNARHGQHVLIAESPDEFVDALDKVRRDVALATRLAAEGRKLAHEHFSWEAAAAHIQESIRRDATAGGRA